ncbi:MAG: lipopolysaccharide biosynthesis protein [Desulfobacterales bacterium]|nr:lipopolysaccharide biosynthesis protein [Desulfobacterales bacterium]
MSFIEKWLPRQFFLSLRWQFFSNTAQGLFGGLYLIYLGRVLGAAQFGMFSLATSLVAVAFMFVELRLHEVVIRFICPWDSTFRPEIAGIRIADLFCLDVLLRAIFLWGIVVLLPWIGKFFFVAAPPSDVLLACAAVHFFAKAGNSSAMGLIRVMNRFDAAAKLVAMEWFLKLVSLVILSRLFQPTVVQAVVLAGIIGLLSNVVIIGLAYKFWNNSYAGSVRICFHGMGHRIMETRRYIFSNLGISLSDFLVRDLDVAITGVFVRVELVGIYNMSKNVVNMMWRAVDPFFLVLMPELKKMQAENKAEALISFIKSVTWVLFVISLGMISITWASLVFFGNWIFGNDFSAISAIFPYMAVWVILSAPLIWAHPLASAAGRPEIVLLGSFIANLVGLILFVPLVYSMGITGAAIGWSLTSTLIFFLTAYLCFRLGLLRKVSSL